MLEQFKYFIIFIIVSTIYIFVHLLDNKMFLLVSYIEGSTQTRVFGYYGAEEDTWA